MDPGLNRCAVSRRFTFQNGRGGASVDAAVLFSNSTNPFCEIMEGLLAAKFHLVKEFVNDTASPTHDRRHAGTQSGAEHANVVRATSRALCAPLPQIPRAVGPGGHSRVPDLLDQRKETGTQLRTDRSFRAPLPLQGLAQKGLVLRRGDSSTQETTKAACGLESGR